MESKSKYDVYALSRTINFLCASKEIATIRENQPIWDRIHILLVEHSFPVFRFTRKEKFADPNKKRQFLAYIKVLKMNHENEVIVNKLSNLVKELI